VTVCIPVGAPGVRAGFAAARLADPLERVDLEAERALPPRLADALRAAGLRPAPFFAVFLAIGVLPQRRLGKARYVHGVNDVYDL
jgi:hypothetical protein